MFVRIHGYLIPSQGCWCTHLMATLPLKGSGSAGGHVLDPWPCGALIGRPPATLLPPTIITDLSSFIFSLLSLYFFASIDLLSLHIFFPRYLCCYTFFVVTVTTIHLFRIPLPLQFPSKLVVSFFFLVLFFFEAFFPSFFATFEYNIFFASPLLTSVVSFPPCSSSPFFFSSEFLLPFSPLQFFCHLTFSFAFCSVLNNFVNSCSFHSVWFGSILLPPSFLLHPTLYYLIVPFTFLSTHFFASFPSFFSIISTFSSSFLRSYFLLSSSPPSCTPPSPLPTFLFRLYAPLFFSSSTW